MNDSTSEHPQPQLTKVCTKCGETKPATTEYFTRHKRNRDGLNTICKGCNKAKAAQWNAENKDRRNKRLNESHQRNPAINRARSKRFLEKHREHERERLRKYAQENREKIREKNRQYRDANREAINARNRGGRGSNYEKAREARRVGLSDDFTVEQWQACLNYFNGCCAACGRPPGLWHIIAMDHFVAVSSSKYPGHTATNIIPLCHGEGGCNNSKHNRDALEWATEKFGKRKGKEFVAKIQAYFDSLA